MSNLVSRAVGGLYQVLRGLITVGRHSFRQPITKEFPDITPDLPGAFRGRLALGVNPLTGEHLCISCRQCERVCPDKCIQITSHKSPETNKPELIDFKIDHGLCMFCGLCTEVCPTNCIINTNDFEMSEYTREALVYDLRKLTLSQEESAYYFAKKEVPLPKPKPAKPEAKPAAAAAKPAAEAKPVAEAKPAAATEPAGQAKAADEEKTAAEAKSADEAKAVGQEKEKLVDKSESAAVSAEALEGKDKKQEDK